MHGDGKIQQTEILFQTLAPHADGIVGILILFSVKNPPLLYIFHYMLLHVCKNSSSLIPLTVFFCLLLIYLFYCYVAISFSLSLHLNNERSDRL